MSEPTTTQPKAARGLSVAVLVGLALVAALVVASLYYVFGARTEGPIAQGGENLVADAPSRESYEAVTDEAPIVNPNYGEPVGDAPREGARP